MRLFNLDLHISVIADVQAICKQLYGDKVKITNWSISGHNWVMNKVDRHVEVINQSTWTDIDSMMIERFQEVYDSYLKTFDGFIVTHTPIFALLYEKYGKPIILVNSCRYDQPYCFKVEDVHDKINMLSNSLKRMYDSKQLIIVSNNAADYRYLYRGTGIVSTVIPSLCIYTEAKYLPSKPEFTLFGNRASFPISPILVEKPTSGYKWSELFSYRGIVHSPYEMSTMSIFEQFWAGVPLFFPSKRFYKECIYAGTMSFISCYGDGSITEEELDAWLDRADFYIYPFINYYDSYKDCIEMLENFDDINYEKRNTWLEENRKLALNEWSKILNPIII